VMENFSQCLQMMLDAQGSYLEYVFTWIINSYLSCVQWHHIHSCQCNIPENTDIWKHCIFLDDPCIIFCIWYMIIIYSIQPLQRFPFIILCTP
jgi:hypothetical protein